MIFRITGVPITWVQLYERGLSKHDLIPKHELLQRSFIQRNFHTIFPADAFLHCSKIKLPLYFLGIAKKQRRCSIKRLLGLRPTTLLKKRLWHRCFPVNCFLLLESAKTSQQFPGKFFRSFESRLTFYWKRHYSICFPKKWNILIGFVCHFTEYLKLTRTDRFGERSVVILKIIYFFSKGFLEFSDLASTLTKKQSSS